MIRRSPEAIGQGEFFDVLKGCIEEHGLEVSRLERLSRYYRGEHDFWSGEGGSLGAWPGRSAEARLVCNYAKFITDMACGYMFGQPLEYRFVRGGDEGVEDAGEVEGAEGGGDGVSGVRGRASKRSEDRGASAASDAGPRKRGAAPSRLAAAQDSFLAALSEAESDTHDAELGKDLSVFGYAYELVYFHEGRANLAIIDPRSAFVVYDDTVKCEPIFAVILRENFVTVYFPDFVHEYARDGEELKAREENLFEEIPLTQYWNNEEGMGDFESVLSLIDAYNILQSDRVNDKQRFVNAILKVTGAAFETDEFGRLTEDARNLLRSGILQLPEDADATYLTKSLSEAEAEILKNSISSDIHKFSQIPDFSDKHFAGNQSGVAMRFKLISLEYLCRVKERFFASGIKRRVSLFMRALNLVSDRALEAFEVGVVFNRELPFEN